LNHRIQKFDSQGKFLMKFGTYGENDAQFQSPRGILVDTDKNIYVSDSENNRIQKFDSQGKFLMQFGYGSKLTVDGTVRRPQGIVADSF
jgi:DNA-binding beta-propeller fold protein YncE